MIDDPAHDEGDPPQQSQPKRQASSDDKAVDPLRERAETSDTNSPQEVAQATAEGQTATSEDKPPAKQKRQIKIGSQRSGKTKSNDDGKLAAQGTEDSSQVQTGGKVTDSGRHKTAPRTGEVPTIDSVVTPELQKEIDQALSDTQIEQLLTAPSGITTDALSEGDRIEGRVLSISEESIIVDLSRPNQGILTAKQLDKPPTVGETISVVVRRFNPQEGTYELTIPGAAVAVENWDELAENMVVEAVVTGHNKGGLDVSASGLRGFIPASQIALFRTENFEEFVGNKFACVITKIEPARRNLVLSRRAVLERERAANKEKMLSKLQVGQVCEGTVSKLQPFGAFVDLGGIDGLVHVSKISWARINHPSEILKEGEAVKVKIERINRETGKISLSYRDTFENPWNSVAERYPPRSQVKGIVTRLTDFGAFIRLESGIEGLLHVSEIAHHRIRCASDILSKDQQIEVQVLTIDPEAQRISLSLKALETPPPKNQTAAENDAQKSASTPSTTKKTTKSNLKGGTDCNSGGEQFGLKW